MAAPTESTIDRAVTLLHAGGLVAIPTETVYGLGADASNERAVRRIFSTKGRPVDHPLIVHLASPDTIDAWATDVPSTARILASRFWPGPLTLVLWRAPSVLDVVTGGRDTVALRVPDHAITLDLLRRFGGGVAAPSANRFGRVSPTTAEHVRSDLGDEVDLVLDGGPCRVGLESTIVDLTTDRPVLLRPGAISAADLEHALGTEVERVLTGPVRAPGMLKAHYAPATPLEASTEAEAADRCRSLAAEGVRVGLIARSAAVPATEAARFDLGESASDAGRSLYAALREADRAGLDRLLVAVPSGDEGIATALADRLGRAVAAHAPAGGHRG